MRAESPSKLKQVDHPDPPKTLHYSVPSTCRSHAASSPAMPNTCSPYLVPPSSDQPTHTNSFSANTFMLRKSVIAGPQSTGSATLFPYSTVNFGDNCEKQSQPVNYAQVR